MKREPREERSVKLERKRHKRPSKEQDSQKLKKKCKKYPDLKRWIKSESPQPKRNQSRKSQSKTSNLRASTNQTLVALTLLLQTPHTTSSSSSQGERTI